LHVFRALKYPLTQRLSVDYAISLSKFKEYNLENIDNSGNAQCVASGLVVFITRMLGMPLSLTC